MKDVCNSILAQASHNRNPPLCMLCVVMTSGQEKVSYTRTDQSFIASTLSLVHTCLDLLRKMQPTIDKLRRLELAVHHLTFHMKGIKTNQKKLAAKLRPLRPMVRDIHKLKAKHERLFSTLRTKGAVFACHRGLRLLRRVRMNRRRRC